MKACFTFGTFEECIIDLPFNIKHVDAFNTGINGIVEMPYESKEFTRLFYNATVDEANNYGTYEIEKLNFTLSVLCASDIYEIPYVCMLPNFSDDLKDFENTVESIQIEFDDDEREKLFGLVIGVLVNKYHGATYRTMENGVLSESKIF